MIIRQMPYNQSTADFGTDIEAGDTEMPLFALLRASSIPLPIF